MTALSDLDAFLGGSRLKRAIARLEKAVQSAGADAAGRAELAVAIDGIAAVLEFGGRTKQGQPWRFWTSERHYVHARGHLADYVDGASVDRDSGLHPLDHAICRLLLMRARMSAEAAEEKTRPDNPMPETGDE